MDKLPNRKSNRLPGYDYSQANCYFVTICAAERKNIFGTLVGGGVLDAPRINLSPYGTIVENTLLDMDKIYGDVSVEKYVIMLNHVHLIVMLLHKNGPSRTPAPTNMRLPSLISTLKRFTNRVAGVSLWQRSYYDHVIRNEADYLRIWQYIDENPIKWQSDDYYL